VQPLRVGVVGLNARVERQVLPGVAASPRARLAAVCSRDLGKAQRMAEPYVGCRAFGDYSTMLAAGEVDAVFVMTPPEQHAAMSVAALEAGCAVMCEKPLAATFAEARAMAAAAQRSGQRTVVNFTYRTSPGFRLVEQLLADPGIGEPLHAELSYLQGRGLTQPGPFRGALVDLGPHALDALLWWLGPVTRIGAVSDPTGLSWALAGRLGSGATLAATISRVAAGRGNAVLATLSGRQGAIRLEFDVEAVRVTRAVAGATDWREVPIPAELAIDYASFPRVHWDRIVGALRGEERFPDFEQGLRVQEVIEAAARSNERGELVSLPLA
jgi:predicted dehydrogenase